MVELNCGVGAAKESELKVAKMAGIYLEYIIREGVCVKRATVGKQYEKRIKELWVWITGDVVNVVQDEKLKGRTLRVY